MKLTFFRNLFNRKQHDEAEEAEVMRTIDRFKENPAKWDELEMGAKPEIREAIMNRLMADMQQQQIRKLNRRKFIARAAAVTFILGAAGVTYQYRNPILDVFISNETIVVKTQKNEIKKVLLGDGSIVWLNGESELSYPERFKYSKREVALLEGEAFFDVHHEKDRPFSVKAGKTLTNVLGTAFNISAYSWLKTINVTVARGKVAVNSEVLLPNDQLLYSKISGTTEKRKLVAADVISWMQGKLSFDDEDFKTVASILENRFNVTIRLQDQKMEAFRFTARFEAYEKLNDILDALTLTRGLDYKAEGAIITITEPN